MARCAVFPQTRKDAITIAGGDGKERVATLAVHDSPRSSAHVIVGIPMAGSLPARLPEKCDRLALFQVDARINRLLYSSIHKVPQDDRPLLPLRLDRLGVDLVLVHEIDELARRSFERLGIAVVRDVPMKPSQELIWDYMDRLAGQGRPPQRRR